MKCYNIFINILKKDEARIELVYLTFDLIDARFNKVDKHFDLADANSAFAHVNCIKRRVIVR